LGLYWSEGWQGFHCDGQRYAHEGPTATHPSHDLAHLLVAANGALAWYPLGSDADVRLAEYNAVFVENLLCRVYWSVRGSADPDPTRILSDTLKHLRWFVDQHYAPFPLLAEEAYRRLCWDIRPSVISRLAPLFFDQRSIEAQPDHRNRPTLLQFERTQHFATSDAAKLRYVELVYTIIRSIARREAGDDRGSVSP
jgi:hypothetical protein